MTDWIDTATTLADRGEPFVIVTVAATRGSTPREAGARMFVTRAETLGTIGGGQLEHQCTAIAARWLQSGAAARAFTRRFTLGANLGQCCGGVADILFEPVAAGDAGWVATVAACERRRQPFVLATVLAPERVEKHVLPDEAATKPALRERAADLLAAGSGAVRYDSVEHSAGLHVPVLFECVGAAGPEIAVFGAGHVGRALLGVLAPLGRPLRWIDSRAGLFPDGLPGHVETVRADQPERLIAGLAPGAIVLIMTHSHPQDLALCAEALRRDDLAFCGLIGSVSKRRQFERRLRAVGFDDTRLARLTCPIGIDGIEGKRPHEIAIAVAAQILQLRDAGAAAQRREGRNAAKAKR